MPDLTTKYLGLTLKNPLVVSASPLSEKVETVQQLEENGVSAVVMYSLFEEQIIHESLELDHYLNAGTYSSPEAQSYFPDLGRYSIGPDVYVQNLKKLRDAVHIPIFGSLNGITAEGMISYAQKMEAAGADAIELNLYTVPTDLDLTSAEMEAEFVRTVEQVRKAITIPLAVKLSPYFTSLPNMARRLAEAGADGLVFFNRFYQPDINLETLEVAYTLDLSTSQELRLPLRWIALLYGQIDVDFALTGGVHTATDMLKALMSGASATLVASELLKHGPARAADLLSDLQNWMIDHEYESVYQMKGSMSQQALAQPGAFERANYMKVLSSFKI